MCGIFSPQHEVVMSAKEVTSAVKQISFIVYVVSCNPDWFLLFMVFHSLVIGFSLFMVFHSLVINHV